MFSDSPQPVAGTSPRRILTRHHFAPARPQWNLLDGMTNHFNPGGCGNNRCKQTCARRELSFTSSLKHFNSTCNTERIVILRLPRLSFPTHRGAKESETTSSHDTNCIPPTIG